MKKELETKENNENLKETEQKETNKNLKEFKTQMGKKVVVDTSLMTGALLIKCRKLGEYVGTTLFLMSQIATFDGKKYTYDELLEWNTFEVMSIEKIWGELSELI